MFSFQFVCKIVKQHYTPSSTHPNPNWIGPIELLVKVRDLFHFYLFRLSFASFYWRQLLNEKDADWY